MVFQVKTQAKNFLLNLAPGSSPAAPPSPPPRARATRRTTPITGRPCPTTGTGATAPTAAARSTPPSSQPLPWPRSAAAAAGGPRGIGAGAAAVGAGRRTTTGVPAGWQWARTGKGYSAARRSTGPYTWAGCRPAPSGACQGIPICMCLLISIIIRYYIIQYY